MTRTTPRRARRSHACWSCGGHIRPGDVYLEQVASPYHEDLGNPHWWRQTECASCAIRQGRGHHLPIREGA